MKSPHSKNQDTTSTAHQALFASTWAYLGVALGALNFIVLFPRLLSVEQVGLIRLLTAAALIYVKFAFFGLDTTAVRFLSGLKPEDPRYSTQWRLLFWLSMVGMFVTSAAALPTLCIYLPTDDVSGVATITLLTVSFVLFVAMLWQRFAESIAQVAGFTAEAAFWRDLFPRATMMFGAFGILLGLWSFSTFLFLWMSSYVVGAVWLNVSNNKKRLQSSPTGPPPKRSQIWTTLRFASYSFAGTAAAVVQTTLDSIMLTALASLTQLGIYTPFAYAAALIDIPTRALSAAAYPRFQGFFKEGKRAEAEILYRDLGLLQLCLGGTLLLLFWINLPGLIMIMESASYQNGGSILLIIGTGLWLSAALSHPSHILLAAEHFRLDGILNLCAVPLGISLNFAFIPAYGAVGAAIATALTILILNGSKSFMVWKNERLLPFTRSYRKVMGILLTVFILNWLAPSPDFPVLLECFLRSTLCILLCLIAAWKLDIIQQLKHVYRRLRIVHG